ncbi:MAG: hypothetical protein WDO18_07550 [Acidobacteriota bacterium]
MAEFRKLFYALGVAALFTGLASTASAQVQCSSSAGVPPIIRAEGFTELVGDYVMDCVGGIQTSVGFPVPAVNITVTINAPITSRLLGEPSQVGTFTEALLLIDEPNSAANPTRPLLACGNSLAVDTSASGVGVCSILGTFDSRDTYNGQTSVAGATASLTTTPSANLPCNGGNDTGGGAPPRPANNAYGCGRPNVFQGRQLAGQPNVIVFNGVPFNPPGQPDAVGTPHRVLRFTNFRVAPQNFAAGSLVLQTITMTVNINSSMSIAISNREIQVASVLPGISLVSTGALGNFVQCISPTTDSFRGNARPVVFREGFASSFKTKGLEQVVGSTGFDGNGRFDGTYWRLAVPTSPNPPYMTGGTAPLGANGIRQNVPGAVYNTESGFTSSPTTQVNYTPNPPQGYGPTINVTGNQTAPTLFGNRTGIENAGIATQGTRIAVRFADMPRGVTMQVPTVVYLYRAGEGPTSSSIGSPTGIAVRTLSGSRGDGPFAYASDQATIGVGSPSLLVYEVLFDDPYVLEDFRLPVNISYTPNLASNLPDVTVTTVPTASGGFAPFIDLSVDSAALWSSAQFASASVLSGSLPIPRFKPLGTETVQLFIIGKCSCNLLFPFVTNFNTGRGNYDTGVAIANTSALPGGGIAGTYNLNGYLAGTAQQGPVQLWYYPADPADASKYPTQCTNPAVGGVCPGTKDVPAGGTLLFSIAAGNTTWGLGARAGFTGYMIAQTSFQYCHAFAYISAQGAAPADPGMSVGYVALQLDTPHGQLLPPRTNQNGENLNN